MAIFSVAVTVTATTKYTVEIDAKDEREAEDVASRRNIYALHSSADFQVDHGDCSFKAYAEQLTAECPECGESHPITDSWSEDQDVCKPCGAKIEAAEAAEDFRSVE